MVKKVKPNIQLVNRNELCNSLGSDIIDDCSMDIPYNPFTHCMKPDEDVPNLSRTSALRPMTKNKLRASVLKSTNFAN